MSNNTNDSSYLIHETVINIIISRCIFGFISWIFCLVLIIVYIIHIFQVKYKLCQKKSLSDEDTAEFALNESFDYNSSINLGINEAKIGLGSHFMFFLAISNFLGAFFDSFFYFYYKNTIKTFIEINNSQICKLLGLSHNFFQLYFVCWTSMLGLLFYRSTNSSNNMNKKSKRYIIIGFLYSTVICIIISLIPYITEDNYCFNRFYCSFRYYHDIETDGK